MRAWLMDSYQGVGALRLGEVPDPQPGPGDVLLNLRLAALNPADAFLASGMYPAKPHFPHILGRDGIGDVATVGAGVRDLRPGETVGVLRCDVGVEVWGTLAEKVVVPAESIARLPPGWSIEEMAAAPLVFLTAWQALTQWSDPPAPPPAGSRCLVTGASGGVGVAALLLAKSMKLTLVALSRNAQKRTRLKELGADCVFDPNTPDLGKTILSALGPKRLNLIIDSVGGPLLPQLMGVLDYGGRISVVGRSGGPVPEFNTANLLFRRIRMGGVSVGDYSAGQAQAIWKEIVRRLDAIERRPQIDSIVRFEHVKEGFTRLSQGPMGKVLVQVHGPRQS
jgi:NADPH2:quinone reductase